MQVTRPRRLRPVSACNDLRSVVRDDQITQNHQAFARHFSRLSVITNLPAVDLLYSSSTNSSSSSLSTSLSTSESDIETPTSPATSLGSISIMEKAAYDHRSSCILPPHSLEYGTDDLPTQTQSESGLESHQSDPCPDQEILSSIDDIPIFSADGSSRPFSSLYKQDQGATHSRQLIIFIRHFYCGACQAYLKHLAAAIPSSDYFRIPTPTNIIVIGCGQPDLIPHYRKFTNCPFPIFAEPTRRIFHGLGMISTTRIGKQRPEYMATISNADWLKGQVATIRASLKDEDGIRKRDVLRGGNPLQVGGEFLFDDGHVVWCHRMRSMRDHTEVGQVRDLLGLDDD